MMISCTNEKQPTTDTLKKEIELVEAQFALMAKTDGIKKAFLEFAAENAVLNRGGKLIKGKKEMADYFDSQTLRTSSLEWTPEFIDISKSGDLAYTYGPYVFKGFNSKGEPLTDEGFFHTVWKKQKDGKWKYVYD